MSSYNTMLNLCRLNHWTNAEETVLTILGVSEKILRSLITLNTDFFFQENKTMSSRLTKLYTIIVSLTAFR